MAKADIVVIDGEKVTLIDFKLSPPRPGLSRQLLRYERMFRAFAREFRPPPAADWLEDTVWPFPSWVPTWRPFDWASDDSDLPATPPEPAPYPEQARLRLYLRPPAPVVER